MIARALLSSGASKVYILGRRSSALSAASSTNPGLIPIECDITSKPSLQAAVDTITLTSSYINLLVANAGTLGPTATFYPAHSIAQLRENMFTNTSMEEFNNTFMVNTTATMFTLLAFLELLDAGNAHAVENRGFGAPLTSGSKVPAIQSQCIVTSSVGAFLREWQCPPAYGGSKSAVVALVKQASSGLARHGIRVNALAPGCMLPISWL
jgi:NAD(P)-dependent dehydrogenase (short-subunit alcohol dehydrogenase family)